MLKLSNVCAVSGAVLMLLHMPVSNSAEKLFDSRVDARAEYNDNIFLTDKPHDSVQGVIVTPVISGIIKEENWQAALNARIKSHNYSDKNLNSNDQYFDFTGRYSQKRNILSFNINYDLASNLNSTSTDFGIVGRRINTKRQSLTPQYTWLLTERLSLSLSYTYADVDYLDAVSTGFMPYITQSGTGLLNYNLTEKDTLTVNLTAVDYVSKNNLVTYQLFMSRIGIAHKHSETLSTDLLIGISRRNSTNLQTQSFDFFGRPIIVTQEVDAQNRGLVLDAGITQQLESGNIEGRISRDNRTNSFGGLDEVNRFKINYGYKMSELWRYDISARIENITSISAGSRTTDRDVLFFESKVFYSISSKWNVNASYRYAQRKFKSGASDTRAPHSNRIYVGMAYNFPSLSTF